MASKHLVKCVRCGSQFDANNGGGYNTSSRRYMCPDCLKMLASNSKNATKINSIIENPNKYLNKNGKLKRKKTFTIISLIIFLIGLSSIFSKSYLGGIIVIAISLAIYLKFVVNDVDVIFKGDIFDEEGQIIGSNIKMLNEGVTVPLISSGGVKFCSYCGEELEACEDMCSVCGSTVRR